MARTASQQGEGWAPTPAALALLCIASFVSGCGQNSATNKASMAAPAKKSAAELVLVVSGDTAGFIVPCGCASKQFGGMPRRATYLDKARLASPNLIYVDAGGTIANATRYDEIKLNAIWQGLRQLNPMAVNLGGGEVKLGAEKLKAAVAGLPVVSCNVILSKENTPWFSSLSKTVDGLKLAWIGVYLGDPKSAGPGLEVRDGFAELQTLVPMLAKEHDAIFVLAYGPEDSCRKIAETFPEVSAVLATGMSQPVPPKMIGGTLFAAAAQKGKFMARAEVKGSQHSWALTRGEIIELSESLADHPQQIENLTAYKNRLKEEKLDPVETGQGPALLAGLPSHYQYAGSQACTKCHVDDGNLHAASKHHRGLETLAAKNFDFDPYCLKCHTTGYGGPGGFKNAVVSTGLGGIGCESCHGPSKAHSDDPLKRTSVPGKNACVTCHDVENSPLFAYDLYWPRIDHGKTKVDMKKLTQKQGAP